MLCHILQAVRVLYFTVVLFNNQTLFSIYYAIFFCKSRNNTPTNFTIIIFAINFHIEKFGPIKLVKSEIQFITNITH